MNTPFGNESIHLDEQGNWFHEGVLFTNQELISLFNRSITFCEEKKKFILKIGRDESVFTFAVTPLIAVKLLVQDNASVLFLLNTEEHQIILAEDYFFYEQEMFYLYSHSRGRIRIKRELYQTFVEKFVDDKTLVLNGISFTVSSSLREEK